MVVQTISVVVPTRGCVNNCKFCVSKTHDNDYDFRLANKDSDDYFFYREDIKRRLKYASLHGVVTLVLTGTGEALQNTKFLTMLDGVLQELGEPFPRIELQTTGVLLTDKNLQFLREMGVTTISLSVSDVFDNDNNMEIISTPKPLRFTLEDVTERISKHGFNVRLSLNMTSSYDDIKDPGAFFTRARELYASQITFRELYHSDNDTEEDRWVIDNSIDESVMLSIKRYVSNNGRALYRLPFGATVYSIDGISTVIDTDCMDSKGEADDILKYLILREDGKLYSHWDDKGSIVY